MVEKIKVLQLDFDDSIEDVLPWDESPELEVFDDESFLLDEDFDEEVEEFNDVFLSFLDPLEDVSPEYVEAQVSRALEEYTIDELLTENEMEEAEAVGILFELGYIGLPEVIENDNEEVQDRETEEE